jgi:hypothetical protein
MKKYGINIRTVASVRINKSDIGEMVNQLLFGDIVEIINQEPDSRWIYIRKLSDKTVGYVIFKTILPINNVDFSNYKTPIEATCSPISIVYPTKSVENFPLHNSPLILSIGTSLHNYNKTTSTFFVGEQEYYINPQDVNINNTSLTINRICESVLNTPYLWAGRSIMGFDCSGFVQCIYQVLGLTIRRSSRTMEDKNIFNNISSIDDAQIGDIILFNKENKTTPSHCGIYLGNNQVIHCSGFVHISHIDNIGIRDEYMEKDPFCFICKILRPKQKDSLIFKF